MESLDPPKNTANVGTSRRRISSILKAPRSSANSFDPEHVETPVQVAMPVEKRNSRRVSFAPATDVLLFSKEKRSGSPVRSPLQDLSATNIPDNRNPVGVIEKGIQPITDMETLLYAPLQTSQERKEALTVSHDAEDLCGERTMMFSADDAAMDLTHSHTMVIADDSDVTDQRGERLSACANMDFFFSMDRGKAEPCSLPKATSSSAHGFDPEFEKLLASISKPTAPRDNSVLHKVEQYAAMMPHDKENQAPTFMTTKRESLPHETVKLGESSNRGVVLSEDTQGMEMTDVITGHIVENATADDPLQCLFPTLDLYRHSEHKEAVRFFEPLKCSSSNSNDKPTTKITVADSKKFGFGVPSLKMGSSLNLNFPQTCPLPENRLISQNKIVQHVLHPEQYANRNSSESDDMDMTRSQTVAIDSRSLHAVTTLAKPQEISRFSLSAPYKASADFEHDMDFTRSQTGVIEAKNLDLGKTLFTVNAGGSVREMADNQRDRAVNQGKITMYHEFDDMEITQSQTAVIESLHGVKPLQMSQDIVTPSAKWNNPSEDDDMEFTTCHTRVFETKDVPIGHVGILGLNQTLGLEEDKKINRKPSQTEVSKYHDTKSDDMEITRSQTVAIDTKSLNLAIGTLQDKKHASMAFMSAFTKACTQNASQNEFGREMHSNTLLLSEDAMNGGTRQREGFEHYNCESDDMEMTKSQTVAIDAKNLNEVNPSDYKRRKSLALTIDHKSQSSGLSMPGKHLGSFFSKTKPAVDTDMDLTRSQTGLIEVKPLDLGNPSYKLGSGGSMSVLDSKTTFKDVSEAMRMGANQMKTLAQYNCESDDMEMTKSQTVAIDAKNLNEVNPSDYKRRKSLALTIDHKSQSSGLSMPGKHLGSFFSKTEPAVDADMDLTRSQTGLIEVKPLDLGNPSYKLGSGGSMSVLDSKTTFKDVSEAMRMGANQMKTLAQYNCESDDMEMTKSQTVAIDAKNLNEVNPLDYKRRKSLALTIDHKSQSCGLSMPGKHLGSFFSKTEPAVDADMDLTRSQTGLIEVKPLDLGNPSYKLGSGGSMSVLDSKTTFKDDSEAMRMGANQMKTLAQDNCESDDMEMTKSQTVAIETKNLNSVHPLESNKRKSLAFLNTIDHTSKPSDLSMPGMFSGSCFSNLESGVATDMGLTQSQTRSIEVKPQILLKDTRAREREGSGQYNSDDMEITKSQTVAIDAKNLIAANPLESKRRKSLAFVSTCTKGGHVREDGYCEDKIQTNPEADSEMEFTRSQTGLIETKHLTFVKPSLKINSGKTFPTLVSNTHLPISMNAVENTKSSHNVRNIFPEANQENDKHALCSEDMELRRSQTVALNCKPEGISNVLFHRARKSLPLLKEKSSELRNPDELDITRSHTVATESKDTHSPDDASLNNSQVTAPPEGLSHYHSGSAGELGGDATQGVKSRVHGLTDLGAIQLNQEAATMSTSLLSLDGKVTKVSDQLDASQNERKSIPLSVDNNSSGASSESTAVQSKHGSELRHENSSLSSESASCVNAALDGVHKTSTKTKRMSLVDIQSKLRRMSRLPNEPTEKLAVDYCDAPSSQPKSSDGFRDKTQLLTSPPRNPETRITNSANCTPSAQSTDEDQPCVTAPLNLNRKSLTSRLSLGNFLPKLPQKIKAADQSGSGSSSAEGHENQVIARHLSSSGMMLDDDIVDEVLPNISSDEDLSMVTENPPANEDEGGSLHERDAQDAWEEEARELPAGHPSDSQGKRPSPVDGVDMMASEKRRRISLNSTTEMPNLSPEKGKCISPLPLAPAVMTQAVDVSNSSNTAPLRSETTFESTLKQSLFESQLEDIKDYTNDFQKNVDDERMTVSEFFKLLNIDFVIHNPRQSILPGKLASHLDHTPEDLLKNRHINHPKQRVYESDHQNLAEKVERLKARMKDQGRLLHSVNKPLWEELKCFSEDKLKQFGSKMKERSYFFRKRSKAQSHEMKEALYSHLLQANLEERQKLQEKTEEADGMLRSLDDCIQELETELAAVEGNGLDDSKPTLKSSQLGLENVTMELADKERQMCEMEMQKKCNMDEVKRLQMEIPDLNGHITMLHRVNEWKVAERRAGCDVYSFLYESLHLEVAFVSRAGKGPEEDNDRNILDINFKLALDEEKSECHARLVHTLLSEFIKGRSDWVEKYPSSRCVPKLLHDVGLVVSRCRLLGEEVRRLRAWGSLRLDVLDVRCVDTRVHIVFSSLEAMAKFELSLAVTMAYPCCPLQMRDFKSHIGSTTAQRIEDAVSSVSPGKNYLTKVVKAIHAAVLS